MTWLARIFTWWNGQTLNTALHTLLFGKFAGKDEFGNRYYRTRKIDKALGFERRWVIYAGESEGSMTPPGWYGWLAAPHGRYTANRRELRRPRVGVAAPAEFDRDAASLASAGLDLGRQCAASGDRRSRGRDAGRLKAAAVRTHVDEASFWTTAVDVGRGHARPANFRGPGFPC